MVRFSKSCVIDNKTGEVSELEEWVSSFGKRDRDPEVEWVWYEKTSYLIVRGCDLGKVELSFDLQIAIRKGSISSMQRLRA